MNRQMTWLLAGLAIMGTVFPWYLVIQFYLQTGSLSLLDFLDQALANPAAQAVAADITISCCVFIVWMIHEARRLRMRHWWIYIALCFIALALAFPLFLIRRNQAELEGRS